MDEIVKFSLGTIRQVTDSRIVVTAEYRVVEQCNVCTQKSGRGYLGVDLHMLLETAGIPPS